MLPSLFHIGPVYFYTYGALIAVGGVMASLFWSSRRAQIGIKKDPDFWLLINTILISGFLGGRVLYLFEYVEQPFGSEFWQVAVSFNKGFSVMGAFGGVLTGVWWYSRRIGSPFLRVLDYICQAAPLWHFFGRLGCFAAGCCYGKETAVPWAVRFTDPASQVEPALLGRPIHPTQLYEAFGNLAIAGLLYRFVLVPTEKGRLRPGTTAGAYFILYAILRIVEEFFRADAIPLPLGLTAAQGFCLALAAGGAALIAFVYRKTNASRPG